MTEKKNIQTYYFSHNFNYDDNKSIFLSNHIYYMYMVNRLFYASKNAFHICIKVGFQNLFFRLSDTHTISTLAPMQSTKITLLSILKQSYSGISI